MTLRSEPAASMTSASILSDNVHRIAFFCRTCLRRSFLLGECSPLALPRKILQSSERIDIAGLNISLVRYMLHFLFNFLTLYYSYHYILYDRLLSWKLLHVTLVKEKERTLYILMLTIICPICLSAPLRGMSILS